MKGRLPFLSERLKNESIFGCFLYPFFSKMINTTKAEIRFINQSFTTGNYSKNCVYESLPRRRITAPSSTIAPTHQTITGLGKDRFEDEDILIIISVVVTGVGFI